MCKAEIRPELGLLKTQSSCVYLGRGRINRLAPGKSKVRCCVAVRNAMLMLVCGARVSGLRLEDQVGLAHGTREGKHIRDRAVQCLELGAAHISAVPLCCARRQCPTLG